MNKTLRKTTKILGCLLLVVLGLLAGAITATGNWPLITGPRSRPLTNITFERTPARLERGRYLTNSVLGCFACHSSRNGDEKGAPTIESMRGGGDSFPDEDFPGHLVAPNISPDIETGAGSWSDDAFARAIREGIGHDGRALFPLMPYQNFAALPDEDLASVIAYVRSIPPVHNQPGKTRVNFPVSFLINGLPRPITAPVSEPPLAGPVERGSYLTRLASCQECHTPQVKGQAIAGLEFAGGSVFHTPTAVVSSANITPDASGISYYDEALFLKTMRTGQVGARQLNSVMPWKFYATMTDDDLKAIYAYLGSLKPANHRVDNAEPASLCKRCNLTHGGGERN